MSNIKCKIAFLILLGLWIAVGVKAGNVELNFFVGSTRIHTEEVAEGTVCNLASIISGAGIDMDGYECRDYDFKGWKVGAPVEGTEVPTMPSSITPTDNMNLYAVFQHTDANKVNSFVRITQTENLETNGQYLILCYYVYGGEQQYYAMSNIAGTYSYGGTTRANRLNATRLYPRNGVITAPDESIIWTLEGSSGAWKWKSDDDVDANDRWLRIGANDQTMLVNSAAAASSCDISQANGIFTIRNTANDSILKYVDDYITSEEDYFITGSFSDYVIYLYKKESSYTSYPDCTPWTVNLDALDGIISGTSPASSDTSLTEASAGAGVILPTPIMTDLACAGWTFAGWTIDAPAKSSSTAPENLIPAGSYDPLYNGVTLYAVYTKSETVVKYTKLTSALTNGDTCIIVAKNGTEYFALGNVTTTYHSDAYYYSYSRTWYQDYWYDVEATSIEVNASGEIIGQQSTALEWRYNSSQFNNIGNTSVYVRPYYQIVSGDGSKHNPYIEHYAILGEEATNLSINRSGELWSIRNNAQTTSNLDYDGTYNTFTNSYNGTQYSLYLFKKSITTTTSYTPYPHCSPYTVHLHACGGNIDGEANVDLDQATATSPVTLLSATPACPAEGWEFVGWFLDEDKESFEHVEFTDFLPADYEFVPDFDDMHLYAVYKRVTDKFKIVTGGPSQIASGDTYVITYYAGDGSGDDKVYDWMLSADTYDANHLKGIKGTSPQNGEGYYVLASDSLVMWTVTGAGNTWSIQNLKTGRYLNLQTDDSYTYTSSSATTTTIKTNGRSNAYNVTYNSYYYGYLAIYGIINADHETGYFAKAQEYQASDVYGSYYAPFSYIYRRVKEYSSWPHCDPFTVTFNPCDGKTEDDGTTKTEDSPYSGIVLPNAYANNDCSKEGWSFAGWCDMPITEETDLMTFDLYPAGTVYHPVSTHTTLYAVYHQKTKYYKRITTVGRLHTGVNYIIATDGNKALANLPNDPSNPTSITSVTVSPDASHIIINENPAIEWRLEGIRGEYEWYNSNRDVYLDLSEPGKALLSRSTAVDNFDITYENPTYTIRSCMNLALTSTGSKFMGYNGTNFNTVPRASKPTIYIYRQQSNYHSYPNCTEDIDIIRWAKVDDEFNRVQVESYRCTGAPDIHGSYGAPELQEDGTYLVTFRNSVLTPCSKALVEWGGVTSRIRIPHIVSSDANITSFMNPADDCSDCNVYVTRGNTLTINQTDSVHRLKLEEGATLNVSDGKTISVNTLVLFVEGDRDSSPEINLNSNGSIVLRNGELYHDRRIDEERLYWLSLPYDVQVKEISYSNEAANGGIPRHRAPKPDLRYFVQYYNGALRAADANGGELAGTYWTYVAPRGTDYTMKAGQGYLFGIGNQKTVKYGEQDYTHTKRVMRFTMRPGNTWLAQERNAAGSKTTTVVPSTCTDERNAVHAGWNLIGNPYLHTYNTGVVPSDGKIKNGAWIMEKDAYGDPTGWYILDESRPTNVPYLTLFDPSKASGSRYSQVLAASHDLKPFEAAFVQINEGTTINFTTAMNASGMPSYKRFLEPQGPVRAGIVLSGEGISDKTGFVLSEEYTKAYEIGADLAKYPNAGSLNLYSMDTAQHQLAFNGLSEEDAIEPIPVGVSFPTTGEYTFAFDDEWYRANLLDTLMLIDYQTGERTNLLHGNYTVVVEEPQTVDSRFAVLIRLAKAPQITTDLDENYDPDQPRKIIRDGHLFILRDEEMYNAIGTKIQ